LPLQIIVVDDAAISSWLQQGSNSSLQWRTLVNQGANLNYASNFIAVHTNKGLLYYRDDRNLYCISVQDGGRQIAALKLPPAVRKRRDNIFLVADAQSVLIVNENHIVILEEGLSLRTIIMQSNTRFFNAIADIGNYDFVVAMIGSGVHSLVCYNSLSGQRVWATDFDDDNSNNDLILQYDVKSLTLFVVTTDSVAAYDSSGNALWTNAFTEGFGATDVASSVIPGTGVVVVVATRSGLRATV
jgi:hypothetical protein